MPHIHTSPGEHDLTTTAFILRRDTDGVYALVHKHKKLGMLLPVGGHVEVLETPWAAVIHELSEESGYDTDQLTVLQPSERIRTMTGVKTHPVPLYLQTHTFKQGDEHYHTDVGFCFYTTELPSSTPHDGESAELIWLTQSDLHDRADEMPSDIVEIYDFCFSTALPTYEQVPTGSFDL